MNRPPPYFPQNQLNPPDPKRYTRFKIIVAALAITAILGLIGAGYGIYLLIKWMTA